MKRKQSRKRAVLSDGIILPPYHDQVETAIETNTNAMLVGPAGTGKSTSVRQAATKRGKELFTIQGHGDLGIEELRGQYCLRNGESIFIDGPVTRAFRNGGYILFDEFNTVRPAVSVWMNGAAEPNGRVHIPETGETLDKPPGLLIFFCCNYGYNGTRPEHQGLRDRCRVIETDYWPEDLELEALRCQLPRMIEEDLRSMIRVANGVRKAARQGSIDFGFSIRTLFQWGADADHRTQDLLESFEDVVLPKVGCDPVDFAAEHETLMQIAQLELT